MFVQVYGNMAIKCYKFALFAYMNLGQMTCQTLRLMSFAFETLPFDSRKDQVETLRRRHNHHCIRVGRDMSTQPRARDSRKGRTFHPCNEDFEIRNQAPLTRTSRYGQVKRS